MNTENINDENLNGSEAAPTENTGAETAAGCEAETTETKDEGQPAETTDGDTKTETEQGQAEQSEPDALDVALAEISDLKDKQLRLLAEFENYKRRTLKERAELILNGGASAVTALLPVVDDLERAIASQQKTDDIDAIREGVVLIHQKLMKTLEGLGVKTIDTADADFSTDLHEAVALVPGMGDDKKGKVIDCLQTGYTMNDKVLRHAKVAVGQ